MKLLFVCALFFAAVFAVQGEAQCKHSSGGGLLPVVREFTALIPTQKILAIYLQAVSSDPEVQAVMEHLASDDFIKIVNAVTSAPEYGRLTKASCETLYFDAAYYLEFIGDFVGWPKAHMFGRTARSAGLRGLVDDVLALIPVDKVIALLDEKLASDEFAQLGIQLLKSKDFVNIVRVVTTMEEYKFVENELRRMNIDVDAVIEFLQKNLGWTLY